MGDTLERYVVARLETLEYKYEQLLNLPGSTDEQTDTGTLRPGKGVSFLLLSGDDYVVVRKDGVHYWEHSSRGMQLTAADLREILEMDDQALIDLCLGWETTCGDHILMLDKICECVLEITRSDDSIKRFAVCQPRHSTNFDSLTMVPIADSSYDFSFGRCLRCDHWDEFKEDVACALRAGFREWLAELADEEKAQ